MNEDNSVFTYELFLKLKQAANQYPDEDTYLWFKLSYEAFTSYRLNNETDLIRLIAFAYSWMPTMAKFKSHFGNNVNSLIDQINSFKAITDVADFENYQSRVEDLLKNLVKIINNSIVGSSKVLHFTNPSIFPIIDSRVVKGWNQLIETANEQGRSAIISGNLLSNPDKAIPFYIRYTTTLLHWLTEIKRSEPNTKMRDLEVYLYIIGR